MNIKDIIFFHFILLACISTYSYAAEKESIEIISNGGYTFVHKRYAPQSNKTQENALLTPEQLRQIKPMPLPQLKGRPPVNDHPSLTLTNPVLVPGGSDRQLEQGKGPQANSNLYEFPYTKAEVVDLLTTYPYSAIGLVVSRFGSLSSSCSGAAVNSDGGSFVMTAAHCVYSKGKYPDSVIFIPAYKNSSPKGQWLAEDVLVFEEYKRNPYPGPLDIAGIGVYPNNTGKTLHKVVGALGFAANIDPVQHWNAFGYPSSPEPYNGKSLRTCQASLGALDFYSPPTLGIGCDMGGGSSGGPWIVNFQRKTLPSKKAPLINMINGINDYSYSTFPNIMFSPYFGDEAIALRDAFIQLGH